MEIVVNLSYSQKLPDDEVEDFRKATQEQITEIIAVYESGVKGVVLGEFHGEVISITTEFLDEVEAK